MTTTENEKRFGICYDPLHDKGNYEKHVAQKNVGAVLTKDMHAIGERFAAVRTFQSVFDNVEIGPYIADAGLKASLGINTEADDNFLERQINAAIDAASDPRRYVSIITVGNENLYRTPASKLIKIIRRIKANVPEYVKVSTVQRPNEYLESNGPIENFKELVQLCDVIGVNIYPFFSDLGSTVRNMEMLNLQWNQVRDRLPTAKIVLTETGWPSQGGKNGVNNVGSPDKAASHYADFRQEFFAEGSAGAHLAADEAYYFQFFDQPYKGAKGGAFEPHFGLTNQNGEPKPNFRH